MSASTRARASPPCSTTESTMEWVMRKRGVSFSGCDSMRWSKRLLAPIHKTLGRFLLFLIRRSFFSSPPAFTMAL